MATLRTPRTHTALTRRIFGAIGVFGSVQSLSIVCAVVRAKLGAIWIGTSGTGLISLFNSTLSMMQSTSQLGISSTAVREISITPDNESRAATARLVRSMALLLGMAGMLATAVLAPLLSQWTFGDFSQTASMAALAPVVLLSVLTAGEHAIMQSFGRLADLARSGATGAVAGVILTVPLLYFFRLDAVVPIIIIYGCTSYAAALRWAVRLPAGRRPTIAETWRHGRGMLSLGLYMTGGSIVATVAAYVFSTFLNRSYSTETVGIFQAGYTVANSYVGILFTASSQEFYPRISSAVASPWRTSTMISHQAWVLQSLLLPLSTLLICGCGIAVRILYSEPFVPAVPFICVAMLGMPLRALSWNMTFAILARGAGGAYLAIETASAVFYLCMNLVIFSTCGFAGAGAAMAAMYALDTAIAGYVLRKRYGIGLSPKIWRLTAVSLATIGAVIAGAYAAPVFCLCIALPLTSATCLILLRKRKNC